MGEPQIARLTERPYLLFMRNAGFGLDCTIRRSTLKRNRRIIYSSFSGQKLTY
jgi:hypothetical protein